MPGTKSQGKSMKIWLYDLLHLVHIIYLKNPVNFIVKKKKKKMFALPVIYYLTK